jgi:hypothetical protein
MSTPVFDEVEPLPGCVCEECARQRLAASAARGYGSCRPAPAAARALVVVAAAAGTAALVAPVPAAVAATTPATTTPLRLTRDQILERARTWVDAAVPYNMDASWRDGYRQDCSGFVSMAWGLGDSAWTGSLTDYAERIRVDQLMPGDILLFHNPEEPETGSHVTIFGGWADAEHEEYIAYEQAKPHARIRTTPFAYWSHSSDYVPYRYKYIRKPAPDDVYPGTGSFGPGAENPYVNRLGRMLAGRGATPYYRVGPDPKWSASDRRATAAFQHSQGWSGDDADGIPGPATWRYLVRGEGTDIAAPATRGGAPGPSYPGAARFRPGQANEDVLRLGRQLAAKGFGAHYPTGPGPDWSEAARRAVEAFQRTQGWSGTEADGYPGPETWRRLFS